MIKGALIFILGLLLGLWFIAATAPLVEQSACLAVQTISLRHHAIMENYFMMKRVRYGETSPILLPHKRMLPSHQEERTEKAIVRPLPRPSPKESIS